MTTRLKNEPESDEEVRKQYTGRFTQFDYVDSNHNEIVLSYCNLDLFDFKEQWCRSKFRNLVKSEKGITQALQAISPTLYGQLQTFVVDDILDGFNCWPCIKEDLLNEHDEKFFTDTMEQKAISTYEGGE